jgi:hypothetical protein
VYSDTTGTTIVDFGHPRGGSSAVRRGANDQRTLATP